MTFGPTALRSLVLWSLAFPAAQKPSLCHLRGPWVPGLGAGRPGFKFGVILDESLHFREP